MAKYDVILFDLDGTLTDPKVGITKSIQYALSKFGISEDSEDTLVSFIGAPLLVSLQDHYEMDEQEARRAIALYREYYSKTGIYENAVYQGISGLLEDLQAKGKKLLVATLKPTEFAERVLEHFGLRRYFDEVVGPDLEAAGLSKTEIIQKALAKLKNIPKDRIIMVGDRVHDVAGARRNGIDSIAITYGYGSLEELQDAGPTYIVDSVDGLRVLSGRF